MRLGQFEIRPTLWPTLATLALLPLLAGLGFWQLERAAWKQGMVDEHTQRSSQPVEVLETVMDAGVVPQYQRIIAHGRYDLEHQLLLDNRTHQGRAGYHVLTPLKLSGEAGSVLVNRGWVPVGGSRSTLPVLTGPIGMIDVRALITLPPEKFFRLGAVEEVNEGKSPGDHLVFDYNDIRTKKEVGNISTHEGDIAKLVELGIELGYPIPVIQILGIEPESLEMDMRLSECLESKLDIYVNAALKALGS